MRPAWQTTEFWVMLITNLVGIASLAGYVSTDQATSLVDGLSRIAGAVLMIGTSFGFIKARIGMRMHMIQAIGAASYVDAKGTTPELQSQTAQQQRNGFLDAIERAGV